MTESGIDDGWSGTAAPMNYSNYDRRGCQSADEGRSNSFNQLWEDHANTVGDVRDALWGYARNFDVNND